jgi:hypothetical protein
MGKLIQTIKRSRFAELVNRTPRTLARWEELGILTPIRLNCRSVVYTVEQAEKILRGEIETSPGKKQAAPQPRGPAGTFTVRGPVMG